MNIKVRQNIEGLVPYPPGKPLKELEREYGISNCLKMASNENPLGPSPLALEAISNSLENLHRYPDGSCYYLVNALADQLDISPDQLVLGNGSNEIIDLLVSSFVAPGDEVLSSFPSFLVYQNAVQIRDGINRVLPLKKMRHDLKTIASRISSSTKLIFLDNPNNPTGSLIGKQEFDDFLSTIPDTVIVVIDEAYVDFTSPELRLNIHDYLDGDKPVVFLRTFSKAYGLAGLRIGYGIMRREISTYLHRVRQPFNVNELAQVGALACLQDKGHYDKTMAVTREGISWLRTGIEKLGCPTFPSYTNFFLVDVRRNCREVYELMLHKGVIVRAMDSYDYPQYIRITVGTAEENKRLLKALAESLTEIQQDEAGNNNH